MDERIKRVLLAFSVLVIFYAVGTFAFHMAEGWTYLDAAYFLTATFTTIGYGDIVPYTNEGKLLTMLFAWSGIGVGFYFIYSLAAYRESVIDTKVEKLMEDIRGTRESTKRIVHAEVGKFIEKIQEKKRQGKK